MRIIAACLLLLSFSALADERILDFHSDILIMKDGWIEVSETIRVGAEGNRIRRGIYRDFPTEYQDKLGNDYVVGFELLSILRNNLTEDFHEQNIRGGKRIHFGSANRYINSGEHTYTFRYRASRMLGFFENHDKLYWNVTGDEWAFPIDSASATVAFGFDVSANDISAEAYTGSYGHIKQHYFQTNGLLNIPAILIVTVSTIVALLAGPSLLVILTIIAMFGTTIFFAIIMKRPTMRGQKLLGEILGFKDYLQIAEKDELNLRNPPEKTPQLLEAFLPYALALGVDQSWSEKFTTVIANAHKPDGTPYSPSWYNGSLNTKNLSAATSQLSNSLNAAITNSVTPPGSSSGGGGGGFSGGDGGGGW